MQGTFATRTSQGRITVALQAIPMGEDLLVALHGGDRSHIGAVAVSQPRPSLLAGEPRSATTSVIALLGHKEDELARQLAQRIARETGATTSVACGIHLDGISSEEIGQVIQMAEEVTKRLIAWKKRGFEQENLHE